ncbi:MAG: GTPase HflX [Peptostreptococcaceae bacterium]|nr:GTPase HflX [Peptostreptococcaceae bacterium]
MLQFNDNNEVVANEEYRAILVGLQMKEDITNSMEELTGLAEAANVVVLGQMIQNLEKKNSATYIGKGKVIELEEMCQAMGADTVIFNDELSGVQLRNLEDQLNMKMIDRTILILDIFADRAISREGKLQVELAQLQYRLPRLIGFGKSLSRQGGIGNRGPGEKKLETDRRHLDKRMDEIKAEIIQMRRTRNTQRSKRDKSGLPIVALVGYTNSGKSALMNKLLEITAKEEKTVFEKDMLFATLDTSQRNIKLDTNHEFILIDTVGFVSKLPHSLIKAFKATLEEVLYADLLLQVVDAFYEAHDFHIEVTNNVLEEIGAAGKEKMLIYNKTDLLEEEFVPTYTSESINISVKEEINIDKLIEVIKKKIFSDRVIGKLLIPYDRGDISSYLCEKGRVIEMEYLESGTLFHVELELADYNRLKDYDTI